MWWASLENLQKMFFIVACIATVLLIIQIILLLIGFAGDGDIDISDGDDGVSLFSIKSIISFFAIGGWAGMVTTSTNMPDWLAVLIAFFAGLCSFMLVYIIFKKMSKLQEQGNLDFNNAINKTATVYLTIPENMTGKGKINLIVQGKFTEIDAMTENNEKIKTDEIVIIDRVLGDTVIVNPIKKQLENIEKIENK